MSNFKGKILLSTLRITSRIFQNSVVYIHTDDDNGSVGFMLNFPLDDAQAATWSNEIGWQWPERMFHGGPIDSHIGVVVHSNDYAQTGTVRLNDHISYTSGRSILTDIHRGIGPSEFKLVIGYCAWTPGQLQQEISNGIWNVASYNNDYVFNEVEKAIVWEQAIEYEANNIVKDLIDAVDMS